MKNDCLKRKLEFSLAIDHLSARELTENRYRHIAHLFVFLFENDPSDGPNRRFCHNNKSLKKFRTILQPKGLIPWSQKL